MLTEKEAEEKLRGLAQEFQSRGMKWHAALL